MIGGFGDINTGAREGYAHWFCLLMGAPAFEVFVGTKMTLIQNIQLQTDRRYAINYFRRKKPIEIHPTPPMLLIG